MDWENGGWSYTDNLLRDSVRFEIRSMVEDKKGNLWLATSTSGVYMITPDLKHKFYGKESFPGISNLQYLTVFTKADSVYVLSADGIYHLANHLNDSKREG